MFLNQGPDISAFRRGQVLWRVNKLYRVNPEGLEWSEPIEVEVSQVRKGYVHLAGGGKFEAPDMSIEEHESFSGDRVFLTREEALEYPAFLQAWSQLDAFMKRAWGSALPAVKASAVKEALALLDGAASEGVPTVAVPADKIANLFEPWDELDLAIERLHASTRSAPAALAGVAAVVAAREALRGTLYPLLRDYQDVQNANGASE